MKKFKSICDFDPLSVRETPDRWILMELNEKFVGAYFDSFGYMLEILLALATNRIHSQKDSWTIYRKIIQLKIKLNEQHSSFGGEGVESLLLDYNSLIHFLSKDLQEVDVEDREYAEQYGIPINKLTPNLVSKLKNFKTRFLPNYPECGVFQ
jgi:hypothetical protein